MCYSRNCFDTFIDCGYFAGCGTAAAERKIRKAAKEAKATTRQKTNKGFFRLTSAFEPRTEKTIQTPKDNIVLPTIGKMSKTVMANPIRNRMPPMYAGLCSSFPCVFPCAILLPLSLIHYGFNIS